jgi:hypothetical protein
MKQDRFLIAILIGIGVLVVAAFVLFFFRQTNLNYVNDDGPAGVVQNYVLALHKGDYQKAYDYLVSDQYKPTYEDFRRPFVMKQNNISTADVQISNVNLMEDEATVDLLMAQFGDAPFGGGYRSSERAELKKDQGLWKIKQMPYPYWLYDWYQIPPEK